jgi:hypothetical protein
MKTERSIKVHRYYGNTVDSQEIGMKKLMK